MGLLDRMESQKKQQLKDAPEEVVEKIADPYATV